MSEVNVVVKPLPGWVFCQRMLPSEKTEAGIIIPESVQARSRGVTPGESSSVKVLAVGDESNHYLIGKTIFVHAASQNIVAVVTNEFGLVERQNGFQTPNFYLFRNEAVAGIQES